MSDAPVYHTVMYHTHIKRSFTFIHTIGSGTHVHEVSHEVTYDYIYTHNTYILQSCILFINRTKLHFLFLPLLGDTCVCVVCTTCVCTT